jgi:molybdenum cofactor guanylyltransferase
MIGLILCGGQSSRMGTDKALLKTAADITWVQAAAGKLSTLVFPVLISVNQDQLDRYLRLFPIQQLVQDNNQLLLKGPLLGILSTHLQHPLEDLFVLACDMPLIEPPILKELYQRYFSNPGADAYVFSSNNEPEPLCGIYRAKSLRRLIDLYHQQQLIRHSMKFALEQINTDCNPATKAQQGFFHNVNSPADLTDF